MGWHDTGDIVDIDAQGFVTIKGRRARKTPPSTFNEVMSTHFKLMRQIGHRTMVRTGAKNSVPVNQRPKACDPDEIGRR